MLHCSCDNIFSLHNLWNLFGVTTSQQPRGVKPSCSEHDPKPRFVWYHNVAAVSCMLASIPPPRPPGCWNKSSAIKHRHRGLIALFTTKACGRGRKSLRVNRAWRQSTSPPAPFCQNDLFILLPSGPSSLKRGVNLLARGIGGEQK